MPNCELCGEPMPPGEEMFKFHGYSGGCPKPPLPKREQQPRCEACGLWVVFDSQHGARGECTLPLVHNSPIKIMKIDGEMPGLFTPFDWSCKGFIPRQDDNSADVSQPSGE